MKYIAHINDFSAPLIRTERQAVTQDVRYGPFGENRHSSFLYWDVYINVERNGKPERYYFEQHEERLITIETNLETEVEEWFFGEAELAPTPTAVKKFGRWIASIPGW